MSEMSGKVTGIFVASNEGEKMQELHMVKAIEQLGLEGDRYAGERGVWSKSKRRVIRQVSLIEQEAIDKVPDFSPIYTRRNIVVRNFPLNDLIGKEFAISAVRMRGVELCDPCQRPSKLSGKPGFEKLFAGFGGLRAEILNTGIIIIGANVSTEIYSCFLCGTKTAYPHVCLSFHPELRV